MKITKAALLGGCMMAMTGASMAPAQSETRPRRLSEKAIDPTYRHVAYGPHKMQFFNFWKAQSEGPTPVLVAIHGGGWSGGAADEKWEPDAYLNVGISVASVEYRRTPEVRLPEPVLDAARAIQFIRAQADKWGLDKTRFAYQGGSAGACTALWLALHDDLADAGSTDTVSRQSTKPVAVFVSNAQTCLDPMMLREWFGGDTTVLKHGMFLNATGAPDAEALLTDYDKYKSLLRRFSPVLHVDKDDPAIFMKAGGSVAMPPANVGHAIHHPIFSIKLKEALDQAGVESYLDCEGHTSKLSPSQFLIKRLGGK